MFEKCLLLILLFSATGTDNVAASFSSSSELDAEMKLYVEKYNSTAASSYYADSSHICASGSYGFAQVNEQEPLYDLYGRSSMGSNTKSMSSALIAILLENNLVRGQTNGWETTMGNIFPDLATGTPYETVTLRTLAAMYAGIPDNADFWAYYYAANGENITLQRENITRHGFQATPMSTPGTEFLYSNWGYVILGHVAEVSLDMTWEDAILKYLILPLEMVPTAADGTVSYYPFGAPLEPLANWGHVYMWEDQVHYPCDPNNPPEVPDMPDFQCDNCPNMGPAGTYSGGILNMSRYYIWTIQCAAGDDTQSAIPLSQQGCLEIQQLYEPNGIYGFGWGVSMVDDGAGGVTKMLSHAGSNTFWIVYVNVFPDLGYIAWAGSNSGRAEEDDMVHEIVAALPSYTFIDCSHEVEPSDGEGSGNDDDSLTGGHVALIIIGVMVAMCIIAVSVYVYVHQDSSRRDSGANRDLRESLVDVDF